VEITSKPIRSYKGILLRNSVAVTSRSDGSFLFLTFIFKRLKTLEGLKRVTKGFPYEHLYLGNTNGWMN